MCALLRKKKSLLYIFYSFTYICVGQTIKNEVPDFDATKYSYTTPDVLIESLLKKIIECNSSQLSDYYINKEAAMYLSYQLEKYQSSIESDYEPEEGEAAEAEELKKYQENLHLYNLGSNNLKWTLDHDRINTSKIKIEKIDYTPFSPSGLKSILTYANNITVYIICDKHEYILKFPQMVQLKNKWFIKGFDFWWQDKMMSLDKTAEQEQEEINNSH